MRLKIHIIFVILVLIFCLSFPTMVMAKGKRIPHGVPFKFLLKKIYALTERVEALENQSDGVLQEYVIETEYHHIGDNVFPEFFNPKPEGLSWEKAFTLPNDILSARAAFIKYNAADLQAADIVINGMPFAMPFKYPIPPIIYGNYILSLPAAIFQPGENMIEVMNIRGDDFEFGELEIWFQ